MPNGSLPFPDVCDWCGDAGDLEPAPDGGGEMLCERCAATFPVACEPVTREWHDMAERSHSVGCAACNAGACPHGSEVR